MDGEVALEWVEEAASRRLLQTAATLSFISSRLEYPGAGLLTTEQRTNNGNPHWQTNIVMEPIIQKAPAVNSNICSVTVMRLAASQ